MAIQESLLQHLGPPMLPIASSALEVILLARTQGSFLSGVAPEIIDINIPVLIPAPQAPQNHIHRLEQLFLYSMIVELT